MRFLFVTFALVLSSTSPSYSCTAANKTFSKPRSGGFQFCGCAEIIKNNKNYSVAVSKFHCSTDGLKRRSNDCYLRVFTSESAAISAAKNYNQATGCIK